VLALIGAGGGAAAVCAAVADWPGWTVRVANRHADRAERLAQRFAGLVTVARSVEEAIVGASLVVNATPAGLRDEEVPVAVELLPRDAAVIDLAYRPDLTPWVRAAREAGHPAADGREMLIVQGAHAFERWFGFAPDLAVMRAALAA
jgi:shikimate dehydrogenase